MYLKYVFIHILLGIISYNYPYIWVIFIIYQLSQLVFNKRVFLFERTIKDGNSIYHTLSKIFQFIFGYFLKAITESKIWC